MTSLENMLNPSGGKPATPKLLTKAIDPKLHTNERSQLKDMADGKSQMSIEP